MAAMTDEDQPTSDFPEDPESVDSGQPAPDEPRKPKFATDDVRHCYEALEKLSEEDTHSLISYAHFKMAAIRGFVFSDDVYELLNEAVARTLDGRRKWDPKQVGFVLHLKGCMRSITSDLLRRNYRESEAVVEFERRLNRGMTDKEKSDKEWPAIILERTRLRLIDDGIALQIFDRLLQGLTRAQICRTLDMRIDVYDAARKRISRSAYAVLAELRGEGPEEAPSLW
jgi:hypothetical protein